MFAWIRGKYHWERSWFVTFWAEQDGDGCDEWKRLNIWESTGKFGANATKISIKYLNSGVSGLRRHPRGTIHLVIRAEWWTEWWKAIIYTSLIHFTASARWEDNNGSATIEHNSLAWRQTTAEMSTIRPIRWTITERDVPHCSLRAVMKLCIAQYSFPN